ncbi:MULTISPECIES: methyl-accepting chemotaxis protein [unclassified Virgibacillus]|uniref:methyl-accepting chemotaxis protein n=1 Tax=unclassified Virgibacillus TaxID=2620237 RepID=UPI0024DEBBE9|nr:methyl-accepting chemotaxis protein [Virgibacillus sp. LDC-1]
MLKKLRFKPRFKPRFKNISIGWKYGFVFLMTIILFSGSALAVSFLIANVGKGINTVDEKSNQAVDIMELGSLTRAKGLYIISYFHEGDSQYIEKFDAHSKEFNELKERITAQIENQAQQEKLAVVFDNDMEINRVFENYVQGAVANGNAASALSYVKQAGDIREENVAMLDELTAAINKEREQAVAGAKQEQNYTYTTQIVFLIASIVIGVISLIIISRIVSRNLNQVVHASDQIANGDLLVEPINYEGKDEIGRLATSINKVGENLRNILKEVAFVSETVRSHSNELTQSANEVKEGSEQIAVTMQQLASGSETQANRASELSAAMGNFSIKVQDSNQNGELVALASNEIKTMTNDGSKLMKDSTAQMAIIDGIVKEAVHKMQGLDEQSKQISQLVNVIKDIAEQTNLLALNAAIEAARAGEQGRGFAVVADEVRKLAEQVSASVGDITGIVKTIQEESGSVAASLQHGYDEVEKGSSQIKSTNETFQGISMFVNEMASNIQLVTKNLSEIVDESLEMNGSIEEIAAISEESTAGVEEASASSQQTSSSMEEITQSSEELAKLSMQLNTLLKKFKL